MNYSQKDWYNELYRIFSCNDSLLTQTQTVKIGECLRALAAGENITYKLEDLYQAFRSNKKIRKPLENYLHQYIENIKRDSIEQSQPKFEQEELDYGNLSEQEELVGNSGASSSEIY